MMYTTMGFWLGWIWMALGILVVAGFAIWLVWSVCVTQSKINSVGTQGIQGTQTQVTAIEVLKQRYARGEITQAQFDEMRRNIDA